MAGLPVGKRSSAVCPRGECGEVAGLAEDTLRGEVTIRDAQCGGDRRALRVPILLVAFLALTCASLAQNVQAPDFTIVALPDTQMYSQDYPANFTAQTQWIVNNQAALNIKFVVGLGDIVNVGNSTTQWANAMTSIGVMDNAGIPYALAIGNHDYDESDAFARTATFSDSSFYNNYVGIAHYQGRAYYGSSTYPVGLNDNFYATMTINSDTYLFLMVEYWPRDGAITWAQSVLAAYPNAKVIVVTHGYEGTDNFRTGPHDCGGPASWGGDNNGEDMWTKFVSQYANIIMVLNGHLPAAPAREFDPGVNGNLVNQIVADYQDDPNGGNGWLRILTFHPNSHTVDVKTYSPTLATYQTDSGNQFTVPLDTLGLDSSVAGIRGRVRAIGAGCSTNDVNGIVSYAQGANAPSYTLPDWNVDGGYYTTPTNLTPGTYTVKANAQGYAPVVSSVPVNSGYQTPARFYLSPTTDEFTLAATPTSQTVTAGSGTTYSVTLSSAGTYAGAQVTLGTIGLPAGVTASFSPATLTGSGTSTLTLSTTSNTVAGTYPFLISGVSGDMVRVASVTLVVQPLPDFSISPNPSSVGVSQGSQSTTTLTSTVVGSFNASVSLSISGLPTGVTAGFSVNPFTAPGSGTSVLTFTATSGATLGTGTVTVTATGGGITHTVPISLTVAPPSDFSIAANVLAVGVNPGGQATVNLSTAVTGLFNSAISLSASGEPSRVTDSFNPASIAAPGAGSSTLTINAASNAHAGTSTITVTGTGGGKTHTATFGLTVATGTAPSVTINQASAQSDPAVQGPINFTVVFSEAVTGFSSSGVTIGGTASFGTKNVTVTGSGTTYNVAVNGMTGAGTVTATLLGGAASSSATTMPSAASTSTDNAVTYAIKRRHGQVLTSN